MAPQTATKELLLEKLATVFVSKGYDGATLANLASATGVSKASLYHHFPGGKPEMAAVLIRQAIARFHQVAFAHLSGNQEIGNKLDAFVEGFASYTQQGESDCLLAVFNHHGTASPDDTEELQQMIVVQFADWHRALADVYIGAGAKNKRAAKNAHDLIAGLYGALLNAKMHNQPKLFVQSIRRLRKSIAREYRLNAT